MVATIYTCVYSIINETTVTRSTYQIVPILMESLMSSTYTINIFDKNICHKNTCTCPIYHIVTLICTQ